MRKKTVVTKEERQGPVKVVGIKTSMPLSKFLQNKLSIVVRPTKDMKFVPDDVKKQVANAVTQGRAYAVLSAWPGRGDVPASSKWGEDWAVIIPDQKADQKNIKESKAQRSKQMKITTTKLKQLIREENFKSSKTKDLVRKGTVPYTKSIGRPPVRRRWMHSIIPIRNGQMARIRKVYHDVWQRRSRFRGG